MSSSGRRHHFPLHDDGAVSSSSEDRSLVNVDGGKRNRRGTASSSACSAAQKPSSAESPQKGGSDREQRLTELLSRASDAIRKEREKVSSLEVETLQLREKVASLLSSASSSTVAQHSAGGPQTLLRQKLHDLALDHFVALDEVVRLRRRVRELELNAATEVVVSPMKSPTPTKAGSALGHRRAHSAQDVATVRRARVAVISSPQQQTPPKRLHGDPHNLDGPQQRTLAFGRFPPEHHSFDAMRSVQQTSSPNRLAAPTHPGVYASLANSSAAHGSASARSDLTSAITTGGDSAKGSYNDVMIHRLRRALAPQPTKEQLGEVVHAMVTEMCKLLRRKGSMLHIKKLDHGVYMVNNKRKVHLTIDSGRLVVKCGGGHVDLLEFLERNRLCSKSPNTAEQ